MPLTDFHPALREWFAERLGEPTAPQRDGWPHIRGGGHTLIAAPTGSGKTLAAFLWAIDALLRDGPYLPDETRVLYVSPLRALSNDIAVNLDQPLAEVKQRDPFLPTIRVLVRTGDTPAGQRAAMGRTPPHILVTTPESLYILLTSNGGRRMLSTVRTVIVDEIHALARDKRGSHLALSLERLEALVGGSAAEPQTGLAAPLDDGLRAPDSVARRPSGFQRIGLSATQKPIDQIARFLVGSGRTCAVVDVGHQRELDLAVEIPQTPLASVCSGETWEEIYQRVSELIHEHRSTLIFVNTRKLAERIAARLTDVLGSEQVTCHHGSLSRERRLDAEQRLKAGTLRALVATASLELGIDIGDVDLAILIGSTRSIATCLQRVGRAGHSLRRIPKGRLFPLTLDELVEAAAMLRAIRAGQLDRTPQPLGPLDILAQQVVAACVAHEWSEDALFDTLRRAWPYRDLPRADFDAVVELHTSGRRALLHRDGVGRRLMARKRARIPAVTCGGAIPDTADYQVVVEPEGTLVGSINEDFAIESNIGDIFQLGNTSWRVLRVEPGTVRVADARGAPPTVPFWLGEAPGRTVELSEEVGRLREEALDPDWLVSEAELGPEAARQVATYLTGTRDALGTVPTQRRIVLERFFDEAGGTQLVVHAPFGARINRAWGLALRKRFCRGFGFELQAAATEEAIVLSLGPQHSFPLESVFDFLHPSTARDVLVQALLDAPMFEARWRWNVTRALLVERFQKGRRVPPALIRMRAADALVAAFPHATACPENLPGGDLPVPMEHPLVRQTVEDCLHEAMDVDGFLQLLADIREGRIERVAVDTVEPSPLAQAILAAQPYAFLDDAPLEERRTQAVARRRSLDSRDTDQIGALDAAAVRRVREEAWPQPSGREEVHEALLWMGYVTDDEAGPWRRWLVELKATGRVADDNGRWFAVDAPRDALHVLRGRMEALGPLFTSDPQIGELEGLWRAQAEGRPAHLGDPELLSGQVRDGVPTILLELEREGFAMRTRLDGRQAWCERRLLARIHRYTLDTLRREIEPVHAADLLRFLAEWQHVAEPHRLDGPSGVGEVVRQLAGFEAPALSWESATLPARVRDYRREWLDDLTLHGEVAWGRLWSSGGSPIRTTPISLVPREDLQAWLALAPPPDVDGLTGPARELYEALLHEGAMFQQELQRATGLLPGHVEMGLAGLISRGLVTCDSFTGLRQLIVPPSRRRVRVRSSGRWSLLRRPAAQVPPMGGTPGALGLVVGQGDARRFGAASHAPDAARRDDGADARAEFVARQLLRRTGVVFRRILLRERIPLPWYDLIRVYRRLELRGEVRGGRFVAGFAGEQFALPQAVDRLRNARRRRATFSPGVSKPPATQGDSAPGAAARNTGDFLPRAGTESSRSQVDDAELLVESADPLNYQGVLTPEPRVASSVRFRVSIP